MKKIQLYLIDLIFLDCWTLITLFESGEYLYFKVVLYSVMPKNQSTEALCYALCVRVVKYAP